MRATCDRFPNCRYVLLSESERFSTSYGHVDGVVGRAARAEVFPRILEFLRP